MHLLAYYYKWERNTVRSLSVRERREWVKMIEKQIEAENEHLGGGI